MRWSAAGLAFFLALTACAGPSPAPRTTAFPPRGAGSTPRSVPARGKVIRDNASGFRLRLETGQACPASHRFAGVRNDGADDLDRMLVPNDDPTSGRMCVYPGGTDQAFVLLRQRALPRAVAAKMAAVGHGLELAHSTGTVIHCPGMPGSWIVVVLSYPSRPAVNLLITTGGCPTAANGHVVASASPSMAALVDLVNYLAR